jgi:hypothetical protein
MVQRPPLLPPKDEDGQPGDEQDRGGADQPSQQADILDDRHEPEDGQDQQREQVPQTLPGLRETLALAVLHDRVAPPWTGTTIASAAPASPTSLDPGSGAVSPS